MKFKTLITAGLVFSMLTGCSSGGEEFSSADDLQEFAEVEEVNYTILSEDVPNFDTAPIPYHDYGYIYLENGSYGFVDADNKNVIPSGTNHRAWVWLQIDSSDRACLYPDSSNQNSVSIDHTMGIYDGNPDPCAGGNPGFPPQYILGSDNQLYGVSLEVELAEPSGDSYIAMKGDPYSLSSLNQSSYYIVAADLNTIYGPYNAYEMASFSALGVNGLASSSPYYGTLKLWYKLTATVNYGLFYEKTENGYVIHSIDGLSSSAETYDSAEPVSDSAMKVTKDGKMGIVDTSLTEVYMGDFEDCSDVINNRGYIKVDGKWLYVEFD